MPIARSRHEAVLGGPAPSARRPWLAAAAALALVSGCSHVPVASPAEDVRAKQMEPPAGKALIYVYCDGGPATVTTHPLWADGEPAGALSAGTYLLLEVEPGAHRLDFPFNGGAATLPLTAEAGQRYYVHQWIHRLPALVVMISTARLELVPAAEGAAALGQLARVVPVASHAEQDRLALQARPPPDHALVYVLRWSWMAPGAEVDVAVGGRPPVHLAARAFVLAEVPAGQVELRAKGANDATLPLRLEPGAIAYVEVVPGKGWTAAPRVELKQVEAPRARAALQELRLASRIGP